MEFRVVLSGDQRMTENVILKVREIAQRCGLETPSVRIIREPKVGPKTTKKKARLGRKAAS